MSARTRLSRIELVLATNNSHKVKEIRAIVRKTSFPIRLLTLKNFPSMRPVVENKRTLEGNAKKKAVEVARQTGRLALADDTGLFVKALGNRPGVYSARFAGPHCTYRDNNRKILRLMKKVPWAKRTAVFRCIAALASPGGRVVTAEGRITGRISFEARGKNGFGYDPVFWVPSSQKTFAELGSSLKNKISHRSQAFAQVPGLLQKLLKSRGALNPKSKNIAR